MDALSKLHLTELYRPEIYAFALRLTQDEERARDLLQDTFFLVVKHYHSFTAGTNFRAWVKTIVRNTFLTSYRKAQRRQNIRAQITPASGWMTATTSLNPAEGHLGAEYLHGLIDSLPPPYRTAFRFYLADLSYREISLRTGLPLGTVKSRVFTARRLLRALLAQHH